MAVVSLKSTALTNADATPPALNGPVLERAPLLQSIGGAAVGAADAIGSTYRLVRVSSAARVASLLLSSSAITAAAADIGLYRTAGDGGAVIDADFFASAVSLAAAQTDVAVQHESGVFGLANAELPLWRALGLTKNPGLFYDVTVTLTAAATAAGTVVLKLNAVDG